MSGRRRKGSWGSLSRAAVPLAASMRSARWSRWRILACCLICSDSNRPRVRSPDSTLR